MSVGKGELENAKFRIVCKHLFIPSMSARTFIVWFFYKNNWSSSCRPLTSWRIQPVNAKIFRSIRRLYHSQRWATRKSPALGYPLGPLCNQGWCCSQTAQWRISDREAEIYYWWPPHTISGVLLIRTCVICITFHPVVVVHVAFI